MPSACVETNASGSAIERSTCVSAAKLTIASGEPASIARGDRLAVLDRAAHEAKARLVEQVVEVLLAPGVGELVEHGHLVAVLAHALARERRADEAGAAADEQFHARIIPAAAPNTRASSRARAEDPGPRRQVAREPVLPRRQRQHIVAL